MEAHFHTEIKQLKRYTHWPLYLVHLLGPGWTPFVFRTALILRGIDSTRCWKHCSEMLVHIVMIASHSCCRFVVCTSMMWISRSTTSQRCSIGLRSGDCGGHLSKVNSLSCSRNQSEMIWALWHGALLLKSVELLLCSSVQTWFTRPSVWGLFITLFGVKGFYICYKYNFLYWKQTIKPCSYLKSNAKVTQK